MSTKQVITVEATGKKWKLLQAAGNIGMVLSIAGCMYAGFGTSGPEEGGQQMGGAMMLFIVSVPVYILGRFGAWWNHG